jgi:hypothetical protein
MVQKYVGVFRVNLSAFYTWFPKQKSLNPETFEIEIFLSTSKMYKI